MYNLILHESWSNLQFDANVNYCLLDNQPFEFAYLYHSQIAHFQLVQGLFLMGFNYTIGCGVRDANEGKPFVNLIIIQKRLV